MRSQQHSERSRGYFNNTNNMKSTIKTIPAVGVCCSPTELLLNKVVCVVVNQILLKLFMVNKPLGSVKFRAVQWSKLKPQKDVSPREEGGCCVPPTDEHGFAQIHGISVYISVISGN